MLGEWESRQKKIERKARHLPVEEKEKYFRYVGILEAGIEKLGAYYLKMESSDAYANAMSELPKGYVECTLTVCSSSYPIHQDEVPPKVVGSAKPDKRQASCR